MSADGGNDEFFDLPDDFEGIDLDTIPALSLNPAATASGANKPAAPETTQPSPRPSTPSSQYSCDDDFDAAFLAEVDVLEKNTSDIAHASSVVQHSRFFPTALPSLREKAPCSPKTSHTSTLHMITRDPLPTKAAEQRTSRKRPPSSPLSISPVKKGKVKGEDVREVLEGFEDEMTCPICCDFFVAAHLGNPCGHTVCGECGWKWISKNRIPTCAICRTALTTTAPIIPNFAVDSTVEKHIQALGSSGSKDWQLGGKKIAERNMRKKSWKKIAAQKTQPKRSNPTRKGVWNLRRIDDDEFSEWLVRDNEVEYEELAREIRQIRATRSRR